jgi:phage portal protein BeeE
MKALGKIAALLGFERKSDPLAIWAEMMRAGRQSKAGPTINLDNALKVATMFACLRVLSQGCAQVPFKLMREDATGMHAARELPLYDLLATAPRDWQTSFEFREQMVIHAGLGNAYVWKNALNGKLLELVLLDPGRMRSERRFTSTR